MKSIELVIDEREIANNDEIITAVIQCDGVSDWSIERLDAGDYKVEEAGVLVERKTPSDMISSIKDGRIRDQTERLVDHSTHPYVLIEGDMSDFEHQYHTNFRSSSVRGMMASIMIRQGVPVSCCSDLETLIDMVARLGRKAIESPTSGMVESGGVKRTEPTAVRIYAQLEGIGSTTAWNLYERFPTVSALIEAPLEKVISTEGVGEVRAKEIKSVFEE